MLLGAEDEIVQAINAEEALELGPEKFDLLLTDNNMPGITGLELIGRIKREYPNLAAIIYSAMLSPKDVPPGIMLIAKPWDDGEIRDKISQVLAAKAIQIFFKAVL
ncbi:MAG: response regulator [Candidatus Parcubacteria bacterium]|nr:response regulator [Candidatus Parcubacteria bacterium]